MFPTWFLDIFRASEAHTVQCTTVFNRSRRPGVVFPASCGSFKHGFLMDSDSLSLAQSITTNSHVGKSKPQVVILSGSPCFLRGFQITSHCPKLTTYNSTYVNQNRSKPEVKIQSGGRGYSRGFSKDFKCFTMEVYATSMSSPEIV